MTIKWKTLGNKPQECAMLRAAAKHLGLDLIITWRRGKGWFAGNAIESQHLIGFSCIAAGHELERMANIATMSLIYSIM